MKEQNNNQVKEQTAKPRRDRPERPRRAGNPHRRPKTVTQPIIDGNVHKVDKEVNGNVIVPDKEANGNSKQVKKYHSIKSQIQINIKNLIKRVTTPNQILIKIKIKIKRVIKVVEDDQNDLFQDQ